MMGINDVRGCLLNRLLIASLDRNLKLEGGCGVDGGGLGRARPQAVRLALGDSDGARPLEVQ